MGFGGNISKPFFVTAISSIMILGGFSFSENLMPEADATVSKYLYGTSWPDRSTYDYRVSSYVYVDPGNTGRDSVRCNDGDSVVNARLYGQNFNSSHHIYITDSYAGVYADSDQIHENIVKSYAYNDSSARTYFWTHLMCSYN